MGERIVIGAAYGINDVPPSMNKLKFNRFKRRFSGKMKEQMYKIQQNMVQSEIQKRKSLDNSTLNELNARDVIKETEKMLITKTKQQLNMQCTELQGIANELSSTIEQKEVILESLRFANTYLGKRVIALEKLMKMKPGKEIKNQEELIRNALNFSSEPQKVDGNEDEIKQSETKNIQVDHRQDLRQKHEENEIIPPDKQNDLSQNIDDNEETNVKEEESPNIIKHDDVEQEQKQMMSDQKQSDVDPPDEDDESMESIE